MSKEVCQVFLNCSVTRGTVKFEGMYYAPGLDARPTDFEQLINNTILQFLSSRESSKTCPKTGGDFGQFGNAAKLREALDRLAITSETFLRTNSSQSYEDTMDALDKARAALAAPPRNCDRFGGDNAKLQKVYYSERGKKYEPRDPCSRQAYFVGYGNWLLAPAQEGGAK